jgi:hypothetical protein
MLGNAVVSMRIQTAGYIQIPASLQMLVFAWRQAFMQQLLGPPMRHVLPFHCALSPAEMRQKQGCAQDEGQQQ